MDLQNQEEEFLVPTNVNYTLNPNEGIQEVADPLALDIDDEQLVKIIDRRIKDSRRFFSTKYNLYERRRKNETYLFGRQIAEQEAKHLLKIYEARYLDNALYEIEASIKPLAMNKLPDLIVSPNNETEEAKDTAESVSQVVDADIKKRNNRVVLGIAFKHLPVYFTGVIKARWNPELGKYGDYQFEVVHPDMIDIDHTCATNNVDDMEFISQILPMSIQQAIMRYPAGKDKLFTELKKGGVVRGEKGFEQKDYATEINVREVWFKWYKRKDTGEVVDSKDDIINEPGVKWEQIRGVLWKYEDAILMKMKNPNYDYEGDEQIFTYDDISNESTKRKLSEEELMAGLMGEIPMDNVSVEKVYKNYFQMPRTPFFLMGYDQWRKIAYDETSRIEQNIMNQDNLDTRGKQIQETLAERGKHVFSKDGGLEADDIEKMDMNDPAQDILVEGKVGDVHSYIPPQRPSPQEFEDMDMTRNRMYGIAGSNAIRGAIQSDVATTNQIAREADFTRADDLVEDTINAASEWIAQWAMQFIKLRYTEEHMIKLLGSKGQFAFIKLKNDMIEDGMEVVIKASGTDKLKAQNNALEMAKLGMIDPIKFYEDMGLSDPEKRAEMLAMWNSGAADGYAMYLAKFVQHLDGVPQMVDQMLGQGASASLMAQPGMPPAMEGNPQGATPTDTTAVPATPPVGPPEASPRSVV